MQEQLISYETAKLAKEKGYKPLREWNPEYVRGYVDGVLTFFQEEGYTMEHLHLAPTQSLLQKWLREEHKLDICIESTWKDMGMDNTTYSPFVYYTKEEYGLPETEEEFFNTYEEALESALVEALNLLS